MKRGEEYLIPFLDNREAFEAFWSLGLNRGQSRSFQSFLELGVKPSPIKMESLLQMATSIGVNA